MKRVTISSMAVVVTLAMASIALADAGDHYLGTYGGTGGYYFLDPVAHGFMTGIHLRSGSLVDAAGWIEQNGLEGSLHGGTGGTERRTSCPSGWVMYGIYGASGRWSTSFGPICINRTTESTSLEAAYGGGGGTAFDSRCTWVAGTHESAVGFQGRSAASLNQIGLVCNVNPRP